MAKIILPTLTQKKTNSEAIQDAITWAKWIAGDNRFHYGYTNADRSINAHHNGCFFCGTNTTKGGRSKNGIVDYEFTYCCNPFVTAALAHGGGIPEALKLCQKGTSWDFAKGKGYDKSPIFTKLGHPSKGSLKPGDILCRDTHVALYIGDGKIAEAAHGDDNIRNSKSWKSSIHITTLSDKNYNNFPRVYRYNSSVNSKALIRYGEVSDRVKKWQVFLNIFFNKEVLTADGIFGDKTLQRTKEFQTARKIEADGIVGTNTLAEAKKYNAKDAAEIPTADEIKTASNYGIRKKSCDQARKIAADNRYHYVRWTSDRRTHECPICKKHEPGPLFGWNCIGFSFHCWKHGGAIPIKCYCGTVDDGTGERILKASDATALKLAQEHIGIKDVKVIKNGGKAIPLSMLEMGDIILLYHDNGEYYHTAIYLGNGKYADSTSGRSDNIKAGMSMGSKMKSNLKVAFHYTGGHTTYLCKDDRGVAVEKIQRYLNAHGFDCGKVDGMFGPATEKAVKAFQKAKGLEADGLCGPKTLEAMQS